MGTHNTPNQRAWEELNKFFGRWAVTRVQGALLMGIHEEAYAVWEETGSMGLDQKIMNRCSEYSRLHQALLRRLPEDQAYAWVQKPQKGDLFAGRTPIQTICEEYPRDKNIVQKITNHVLTEGT